MRVAVTGATGFLGSHLTRRLLSDGHSVSVLVRDAGKLDIIGAVANRVVVGDIRDPERVTEALRDAEVVFHLVSNFRTAADPAHVYHEVNVEGTANALAAAASTGAQRFIHCSTIGVHGDVLTTPADEASPLRPGDLYQSTKLAGEALVLDRSGVEGMDVVVIRPCSMYGPGDLRMLKMFRMLTARTFMLVGQCQANFHAVYIDDLVDGFLQAMSPKSAAGEVFLIGGAEYVPLREYIREAAKAVGSPMPWIRIPYAPMYLAGALCEAVCVPLGFEPPLHRRRVRFYRSNRAFSIAKARTVLHYDPKVGLEEGMRRTVAWYRAEGLL